MSIIIRDIHVSMSREHVAVMSLVARGLNYREIGRELGLSRWTVYNRVLDVRNALGAQSRTEALCLLLSSGVLG